MSAVSGDADAILNTPSVEFETDKSVLSPGLEVNSAVAVSMDVE